MLFAVWFQGWIVRAKLEMSDVKQFLNTAQSRRQRCYELLARQTNTNYLFAYIFHCIDWLGNKSFLLYVPNFNINMRKGRLGWSTHLKFKRIRDRVRLFRYNRRSIAMNIKTLSSILTGGESNTVTYLFANLNCKWWRK